MNTTKKELTDAILTIAKAIGLENSYNQLIQIEAMPELIKNIVYDMFLHHFTFEVGSSEEIARYQVKLYAIELHEKGFVEFK